MVVNKSVMTPKLIPFAMSTTEATDFCPPKLRRQVPWSHGPPVIESVPACVAKFCPSKLASRKPGDSGGTYLKQCRAVAVGPYARITIIVQVLPRTSVRAQQLRLIRLT